MGTTRRALELLESVKRGGLAALRSYSQILFSRSPRVGLLLVAATAVAPRVFFCGLVAVAVSAVIAALLDFDRDSIGEGVYGYSALLLGVGAAATFADFSTAIAVAAVSASACVPVTASLRAVLGRNFELPVLTLPFLVVFHLVLAASSALGLPMSAPASDPLPIAAPITQVLPSTVALFFQSLGAVFFLPRADAGLFFFGALLLHSRIASLLAILGFALAHFVDVSLLHLQEPMTEVLGYNAVFAAVGLGGVWFVPSTSSFVFGLGASLLATLFTVGVMAPLGHIGVPVLVLPFNAAALLLLLAARQRAFDRRPKSVDFLSGTPEENLGHYRTRIARFRSLYLVRFCVPFRGRWTCTQGVSGEHTHKGPWRHAFDFEVLGSDGRTHRGEGTRAEDYHCFRLPVLAAAAGTVVKVVDDVPDNAIGEMNLERNWGNLVMLHHGGGLYSLVAHLARGSAKVYEGQVVRAGDVLGLCGNSGRSPTPHIHFQLQGRPQLGAETLPCEFNDVVMASAAVEKSATEEVDQLHLSLVPQKGDTLRNLEPDDDTVAYFRIAAGESWEIREGEAVESIACDVDLYGNQLLRSERSAATMTHLRGEDLFTAYDVVGAPTSVLHVLRAGLGRVPLEPSPSLAWTDYLPARYDRPGLAGVVTELLSPFLSSSGIEMRYRLAREGQRLVVRGESEKRDRRGHPIARTVVELERNVGPVRAELTIRGRTRSIVRARVEALAAISQISTTRPVLSLVRDSAAGE